MIGRASKFEIGWYKLMSHIFQNHVRFTEMALIDLICFVVMEVLVVVSSHKRLGYRERDKSLLVDMCQQPTILASHVAKVHVN